MPSPFPGMDPFLEDQKLWSDFHTSFLTYCRDALNESLPEPYIARLEEQCRLMADVEGTGILRRPDIAVEARSLPEGWTGTGEATATIEPQTRTMPDQWTEVRDVWIEIRHRPDRRLVTAIEVLSPTNKAPGAGFQEYMAKRRELVREDVHLVELDLLLEGRCLPLHPEPPSGDYFALVSRAERRPQIDVYAWSVRRPLPKVPIPLLPIDADASLDLAALFEVAYERGRYAREIDYARPLSVPLAHADKAWAEDRARKAP